MVKYNYFENLERISDITLSAVRLACLFEGDSDMPTLRKSCDRLVCDTEDALFNDFIPPLERDNIAATAHTMSRVIDKAYELMSDPSVSTQTVRYNEEAVICVKLAEELKREISCLKRIKHPDELPDIEGYRALLSEGREAHRRMLSRIRSGAVPKSAAESVILTGRLRAELSLAFDEIVEIMLNNI